MGTKDKLIQRFISMPKDFTWEEMNKLLINFGYEQSNKGKTSSSRVVFKNSKYIPIMLHKPHPGNIIKEGNYIQSYTWAFLAYTKVITKGENRKISPLVIRLFSMFYSCREYAEIG